MTAGFNLRTARHVGGAHDDADQISSRATWWDAPGVDISVTLFRRGKTPTPGVPNQPGTTRRSRQALARRQAEQRAAERAAAGRCSRRARTTGCSTRPRPGSCCACSPSPPRPARSSPGQLRHGGRPPRHPDHAPGAEQGQSSAHPTPGAEPCASRASRCASRGCQPGAAVSGMPPQPAAASVQPSDLGAYQHAAVRPGAHHRRDHGDPAASGHARDGAALGRPAQPRTCATTSATR